MKKRLWIAGSFAVVFGLALLCILPYLLTLAGYDIGYPVDPAGQSVLEDTSLKPGDRVIAWWNGDWWKAEVIEVHPDGKIKVHYTGWDSQWDEVLERDRLQLPLENQSQKAPPVP